MLCCLPAGLLSWERQSGPHHFSRQWRPSSTLSQKFEFSPLYHTPVSMYGPTLLSLSFTFGTFFHTALQHWCPSGVYTGSSSRFRCCSYTHLNYAGILRLRSPGSSFLALVAPYLGLSYGSAHIPQPLFSRGLNQCASS